MMDNAPAFILVRPQLGENIGMAARAMRNFGLSDLRIVAPRDGWGSGHPVMDSALAAAAGAGDIVSNAPVFASIADATTGLTRLYATTARERGQSKPVVAPAEEMPQVLQLARTGGRSGFLFGAERTGLTNDDVSLADAVMSFPVNPDFASLNLAQAVLLVAYDWHRTAASSAVPRVQARPVVPAQRAAVLALFDDLEIDLAAGGYFREPEKRGVMMINLRNILHRIGLQDQDVRTLRGVVQALKRVGKTESLESLGGKASRAESDGSTVESGS